jgi:hypothetical protein
MPTENKKIVRVIYTRRETAKILGICLNTLDAMIRSGEIITTKLKGNYRINLNQPIFKKPGITYDLLYKMGNVETGLNPSSYVDGSSAETSPSNDSNSQLGATTPPTVIGG